MDSGLIEGLRNVENVIVFRSCCLRLWRHLLTLHLSSPLNRHQKNIATVNSSRCMAAGSLCGKWKCLSLVSTLIGPESCLVNWRSPSLFFAQSRMTRLHIATSYFNLHFHIILQSMSTGMYLPIGRINSAFYIKILDEFFICTMLLRGLEL